MPSRRLCACAGALCAACAVAVADFDGAESDCPAALQVAALEPSLLWPGICRVALPTPADAPEEEVPVRLFSTIALSVATAAPQPMWAIPTRMREV
jgi:hypothetical protein